MTERLVVAAALTAALFAVFDAKRSWSAPFAVRLVLYGLLSWTVLGWTVSTRVAPEAFPLELAASESLMLQLGAVLLGAAAFTAARGRGGLSPGAAFGLIASAVGWCASRWPQLSRGVELCGGVFLGLALSVLLTSVFAATCAGLAAALVREELRASSRRLVFLIVGVWAVSTFGAEFALSRVWGFGPRSLAAAAGVPTGHDAKTFAVAWLYPEGRRAYRVESRRMATETTDLSPDSIARIEKFLARTRFRGVFAAEALSAVRRGRLEWWDEERALDALMISVPGRAHPDYLRALELLRAGQVSAERYGKLDQLSAATGRRVEGFEKGSDSQRIFEGFSAAYARFGDEVKAREWLTRLDGLWAVSEKRIEVGSLEDLRDGRVDGTVLLDDQAATSLRVGLFRVWRSSVTQTTHYWLSGSRVPGRDGSFYFDGLGPGRYALALLGRADDLRGAFAGVPGYFEVTYERPEVSLPPIGIHRELAAGAGARFVPAAVPQTSAPMAPKLPPLRLGR